MASRNQRRKNTKLSNENIEILEKKRKNNPVMWVVSIIILLVIIITFVGAPVAGKVSSGNRLVFGSYDGEEITYYEGSFFADQVNSIAENYRDSMTDVNAQFIQFQVWRSAYNNAVYRTAAIKELKNSGVRVSSEAVDEAIVLYGPYMENGEFSENLYAQSSNTEKKYIRDRYEEDLYYNRFISDSNINMMNNNEADFFKNLASVEKKFRYTVFAYSEFPNDKIKEYGTKNADLFRSVSISKITVNSGLDDAEQIYAKLEETPGMFTELAKTQSTDPYADKGGEMGTRYYYELKNLISDNKALDTIFALGTGEISDIIEGDDNWVIYRCDSPSEYADMSKESSLETVKSYMERYAKGDIEDFLVEKADNFAEFANSEGFDEAASATGINVYETNSFPIIYGNPSVYYYNQSIPIFTQPSSENDDSFSAASGNEFFLKSINQLELNDISEALILNDKVLVVQLLEKNRKDTAEGLESIPSLVAYAAQDWFGRQHQEFVFQSEKFDDNFTNVFSRIFNSN